MVAWAVIPARPLKHIRVTCNAIGTTKPTIGKAPHPGAANVRLPSPRIAIPKIIHRPAIPKIAAKRKAPSVAAGDKRKKVDVWDVPFLTNEASGDAG